MSTPTSNSQELKRKSSNSIRRMKSFKRSLLMLGGLSKLQRRSITALIQEYWLENAKINLDTSTTQMNNETIGTHNDGFTDSSQLTSTDTDSDSTSEQRSQSTSTSSNLQQSAHEYFDICGNTTPRRKLQQAAVEYFDIHTESSDTDPSNELEFNHFSPANELKLTTFNKFTNLEALDTESDSDDDMDITENEIAEKEEKISQLEHKIINMEIDTQSEIEKLQGELERSHSLHTLYQSKYRTSEDQIRTLKDQVQALLKEQNQCANTEIIDHVIRKHYDQVVQNLVRKKIKEDALKNRNIISRFLVNDKEYNNMNNEFCNREVFEKTRMSLLKGKDFIEMMSDEITGLVPVTEIDKMEKKGSNFKLHLEMVLAKLTRAYAKKLNIINTQ